MVNFRSRRPPEEPQTVHDDPEPRPLEWRDEQGRYIMTFPIHPLPSMQAPFEESMLDATGETGYIPFQPPDLNLERRQKLLCRDTEASELDWNFSYNCHWRHFPKGKYHPLSKTIAQITFGVHLLHQHLEKSVSDVADILLKHVNELDSFLHRANEDIEGSLKDMLYRRQLLKVPMEHVNEFDRLLDDRLYRAQLLDGNITIERTINRMSVLLNDYITDATTFRDANAELHNYLHHIGDAWTYDNDDTRRIYSAMCGNTSGWAQFLQSLVVKAEKLGVVLVQVSSYCNEIEKRCGAASRRSFIASRSSSRTSNSRDTSRSWRNIPDTKPLPSLPDDGPSPLNHSAHGTDSAAFPSDMGDQDEDNRAADKIKSSHRAIHSDSGDTPVQRRNNTEATEAISGPIHQYRNSGIMQIVRDGEPVELSEVNLASGCYQRSVSQRPDHSERTRVRDVVVPEEKIPCETKQIRHKSDSTLLQRAAGGSKRVESSPLLTGKDSAYSSGASHLSPMMQHPRSTSSLSSGPSYPSPMVQHPRSASALSSYSRPQFGLFPSSPSTPHHPVKGGHGALSPMIPSSSSSSLPKVPEHPPSQPLPRSQSALDTHSSSPRRLLKKTSLSSIKRLFSSKKRNAVVDSIAE